MKKTYAQIFRLSKLLSAQLLAFSLISLPALAQDEEVALKTTKVRDNIYMIEGANGFAGGNVAVSVGDDGVLVVDSLLKNMTDKLSRSLAKLSSSELRYLLNTHAHGDHTGGNANFSTTAAIIAHDNVRKRMSQPYTNKNGTRAASSIEALPILTFNDAMTVHFNQDTVQLKHYSSGHTDGDSIIYFVKANVLHMGDDFFKGNFPYIDLGRGGSIAGLTQTIGKVIAQAPQDVLIIPGHGALANLKELTEYYEMLQHSIKTVSGAIKAGKTLEQMQAVGLGKRWTSYGSGFISEKEHIKVTYLSLQQTPSLKDKHHGGEHHH